ncbi:MAG: EAL domain-containing protein [Woeseia sp.]
MTEQQGISIAVLTKNQDDVELVNGTLRDAGHAAHCHWIDGPKKFERMLGDQRIELIILHSDDYPDDIRQVVKHKDTYQPEVRIIALKEAVDEASIQAAMNDGACDLVSIGKKGRLQAVVARELRAFRVERALNSTLNSATEYKRQLNNYMQSSTSAIANVQEGIITDINRSWLKMLRLTNKDEVIGQPIMDYFEAESQAAIKGAIVATEKGRWQLGEKLIVKSTLGLSEIQTLELIFQLVKFDDDAYVQIRIAPPEVKVEEPTKLVHDALKRDPTTLLYHRAQYLERVQKRLKKSPESGLHLLAYIKPDDFSEVRSRVGILDTEEVLAQFAEEVRKRLHPRDIAGRFEGTVIMTLLERGNEGDGEVWARQLCDHIEKYEFKVGDVTANLTCTVGICAVSGVYSDFEELISAVATAHDKAKESGGNCVHLSDSTDETTRLRKYDAIWVKRIKSALTEKRFRLAQLPIVGLRSESAEMYDMLVRMIDEQGSAVLPSEFLPAAERNNLMQSIDRWIITASMDFCMEGNAGRVFVRLSGQSMQDSSLIPWLGKVLKGRKLDPARLCLQVPEREAAKHIKQTQKIVAELRKLGVCFALEHYGIDKNRFQILDILKPNYIKIDGELMHTLTRDTDMQNTVQQLASAAEQRNIETIAERVENANAMAVLFQLGVNFMQGHYVQEPEVVPREPEAGTAESGQMETA